MKHYNITYAQWRLYELIEATARKKAVSKQIIFDEQFFKDFLETFFQHVNGNERRPELLEPYWPGISDTFRSMLDHNYPNIISDLIKIYKKRNEIKQALAEEEAELEQKNKLNVDTPRVIMDIKEGSRRMIITSDGILTVEYNRLKRGIKQTVREEHSSSLLLDMVIEKCGGGFANEEDI